MTAFNKVLVANRGEIALRVIRTLQEMGIRTVAVASEVDRNAPHALAADEAYIIGPAAAAESYLNVKKLLEVVRSTGSEAIHPGYGFLSENADFAQTCIDAGIAWIGPPAEAIRIMGSKTASREVMEKAGVPVVPGFHRPGAGDEEIGDAARAMGWPVLIKASAGGGGKGMRVVESADEFAPALALCRSEAGTAFGDDTVYIERYLKRPRHIEIQIFGDAGGHLFHLGERECSVQRRHQKILEETPSPAVDADLRERMGHTAVEAARAVDYRNAGTVEFLLDETGEFYFLEMNTRLQVEHPVTEWVYGVDLVAAQIETAAGRPLPFDPAGLTPRGHAIEARVYAEDPAHDYLPQTGRAMRLVLPERPGVRVDSGLREGLEIGVHYDPLLAKITAWGVDRDAATRRLISALREFTLLGVRTNVDFLADLLALPAWSDGALHTGFIEENLPGWNRAQDAPAEVVALAAEAFADGNTAGGPASASAAGPASPWASLGPWRSLESGGDR